MLNLDSVNRFEVIDHTASGVGRTLTMYNVEVMLSLQDNDKTLKVFLKDRDV